MSFIWHTGRVSSNDDPLKISIIKSFLPTIPPVARQIIWIFRCTHSSRSRVSAFGIFNNSSSTSHIQREDNFSSVQQNHLNVHFRADWSDILMITTKVMSLNDDHCITRATSIFLYSSSPHITPFSSNFVVASLSLFYLSLACESSKNRLRKTATKTTSLSIFKPLTRLAHISQSRRAFFSMNLKTRVNRSIFFYSVSRQFSIHEHKSSVFSVDKEENTVRACDENL